MRSLHVYLNSSVLYGASVVIMALFLNARAHPKVYQMRMNHEEVNRASYQFNKEHAEGPFQGLSCQKIMSLVVDICRQLNVWKRLCVT